MKRRGVRAKIVKMTAEIMITLIGCLEHNPQITLESMRVRVLEEHDIELSISTISRHLLGVTYTMKQVRMEADMMNHHNNKVARREFAVQLQAYRNVGCMIIYCDETNYNTYVSRSVGRAPEGERVVYTGPINQGQNLQIPCCIQRARPRRNQHSRGQG
jgi:hypothetical protein